MYAAGTPKRAAGRLIQVAYDAMMRGIVDRIETDRALAGELVNAVANLSMTRSIRAFGTLCGRECTHLLFHHDAEESHVFPVLEARADAGIVAVVAKLRAEHLVIYRLLDDLDTRATAVAAAQDVETYAALRETFGSLHAVL